MAFKAEIYKSKEGKFGLSHVPDEEPKDYPFDTKEEATEHRDRIHAKNTAIEQSTSGVGGQAEGELHVEINRSSY